MKIWSLSFFLLLFFSIGKSQNRPFAVWDDNGIYRFVQLDAATGTKTNINQFPGGTAGFVAGDKTAFNPDLNLYYCQTLKSGLYYLNTIDAATGNIIYSPQVTENYIGLEYNYKDSLLYALRPQGSLYDLVTVDPVTANYTVIQTYAGSTYVGETFALDYRNNLYCFVHYTGTTFNLTCHDIYTGATPYDNQFTDNLIGYQYSCPDSAIYALWENAGVYKVEKVNYTNGTHTTVGVLPNVTPGYVSESSSINNLGELTYRGFDGNNNFSLISIDVTNATVIHNTNSSDNAAGFQEPNKCVDTASTVGIDEKNISLTAVFPNPVNNILSISSVDKIHSAEIYDLSGKKIFSVNIDSSKKNIDVAGWPEGIYLLKLVQEDNTSVSKFIIAR